MPDKLRLGTDVVCKSGSACFFIGIVSLLTAAVSLPAIDCASHARWVELQFHILEYVRSYLNTYNQCGDCLHHIWLQ